VSNQFEITNGHLSKIADTREGAVLENELIRLTDEPIEPKTVHHKQSYNKNERIKLIKHAKKLGFSLIEIKKLLVYWNKQKT
jgi:hypothetical protein